jgi:hypothetical protein
MAGLFTIKAHFNDIEHTGTAPHATRVIKTPPF